MALVTDYSSGSEGEEEEKDISALDLLQSEAKKKPKHKKKRKKAETAQSDKEAAESKAKPSIRLPSASDLLDGSKLPKFLEHHVTTVAENVALELLANKDLVQESKPGTGVQKEIGLKILRRERSKAKMAAVDQEFADYEQLMADKKSQDWRKHRLKTKINKFGDIIDAQKLADPRGKGLHKFH